MFQPFEDLWSSPKPFHFPGHWLLVNYVTNKPIRGIGVLNHLRSQENLAGLEKILFWPVESGNRNQRSSLAFLKKYVSDPSGEVKEREPEKEEGTPILHMSNWYCGGQKKRSKETHAHWLTGVSNMKTLMLGQFILCTPRKGASSCAFCWGFHIKKTPPIGRKACALDGIKKHSTPFEHSCLMFQCSPQGQPPEPMWFHRSFRYHLDSFKQVQDSNKFWSYEIVLTS